MPGKASDRANAAPPGRICNNPAVPEITAVVMALIIERPMCVECIAARAQVPADTIKSYIDRMRASVHIQDGSGRCRTCGRGDHTVFWLSARPDAPASD